MPAIDRSTIEQDIVRIVREYDAALTSLPVPLVTTSTAADTATIISTQLGRGTRDANAYDGRLVKVLAQGTTGPAAGTIAGIVDGSFTSNDRVTVLPAFPTGVTDGKLLTAQSVLVYPHLGTGQLAPEDVLVQINNTLRLTDVPQISFPSLVPDADFMGVDVGASIVAATPAVWIDVTTPTSRLVQYTANAGLATQEELGFLHRRALRVVTSEASEGMETTSIPVSPGEVLYVTCWVYSIAATVTVAVIDQSQGGASLASAAVTIALGLTEVRLAATIPAGCNQARLRFTTGAAGDFIIAAPVIVQSSFRRLYNAPYGCEREEQIGELFVQRVNTAHGSGTTGLYSAFSGQREPLAFAEWQTYANYLSVANGILDGILNTGVNPVTMNPLQCSFIGKSTGPVGVQFYGPNRQLSNAAAAGDTLVVDRDFIVLSAVTGILRNKGIEQYKAWSQKAEARARALRYGQSQLVMQPTPEQVVSG